MHRSDPCHDLQKSLSDGNVTAFVGAGLSIGAGLPGWYPLISELSRRIGYDLPPQRWATSEVLINAAQAYINERSLFDLVVFLKDRLDTTGKHPSVAHEALARLPIPLVFTANYDDLLERAYQDAGKRVQLVVKDTSIPFMRRDLETVNIVKLYGDLTQPETIVLARQQYESFFLERPQLVKLLEVELGRSDMLYLGWSHNDPHINLVFGELLNRFRDFMHPGYAVMFDVSEMQQRELERKRIRLVQLPAGSDHTAQLAAWLDSLAPAASSKGRG
ncbi:MAG: SIR2 family protein [Chloroflexi bacterium]|nr:SIR2 family protein [Chloroflexota bacterium]